MSEKADGGEAVVTKTAIIYDPNFILPGSKETTRALENKVTLHGWNLQLQTTRSLHRIAVVEPPI
jgi:hypothetical protein